MYVNEKVCKPGMWPLAACAWSLEILWFARQYACVSVCPPLRPLITIGMIWCDIGHVRLVEQVLRLFPAFNYFVWHLPLIKWMDMAILTTRSECLPKKTKVTRY